MGTRLWEIATYHSSLWATWMAGRYWRSINTWHDPWLKSLWLHKHFNGQSLLTWGPPSEVSVAAFIKDGMWCKPARWPSEFDNIWDEISQLDIGGTGSDILVWTGSKIAYIWMAMLKSMKIPTVRHEGIGEFLVWFTKCDTTDDDKKTLQFILALTFWTIWGARNEKIFCHTVPNKPLLVRVILSETKARFIGSLCEDSGSPLSKACRDLFDVLLVQKTSLTVQVKWTPPPIGWVKANSDESLSQERFGFGAITKNSSGDCIQALDCA
ncbi:hypothetical protein QJS10_CPB12g00424 [Acorus calamus]|uniref:Reverse transcriptase zinc-binding domain-containing protein n=1 Tax=Acorus calamus TaxID=4465 RepID=A0AAV9DP44_ACOCL|nr:hypothetical protein QJS10_CPB12g00424 [Acorus calamus]